VAHEGTVVADRFEIVELAGRGGMGAVYRARDRSTGTQAAIKILANESTPAHRERFAREAKVLAELTYPAIVRYLSHGATSSGAPYLAMEWLDGEDISARLKHGGLTAAESVAIARKVAEALGAAHARGIVHRDIKPSNLFLVGRDPARVKVLDFGIARAFGRDMVTRTGAAIGTPGYMAPEQARGSKDVDCAADVFSLGCVLFECLAGRPPFTGDSSMAVLAKILLEDAPRLSTLRGDLPAALEELVARMLAKDPRQRPRDGSSVAAELEALGELAGLAPTPAKARDSAVSFGEQRLVCVVFASKAVAGTDSREGTEQTMLDPTEAEVAEVATARTVQSGEDAGTIGALSKAVSEHGGAAEVLADGSVVVTVFGHGGAATDQAARAARCALAVRRAVPSAPMALAIGRSVVADRVPLGELIDRAATLLRRPVSPVAATRMMRAETEITPIRVDEVSAGLLDLRFSIVGDDEGLVLAGERDVADAGRTLLGRATPCVGRERELGLLEGIYDECAREPMAHVVLVTAAAGVGKSRLRHELLQRIGGEAEIWIGRGNPISGSAPFAMLAQALRRTAGILEGELLTVRQKKLKARVLRHVPADDAQRICEFLGELVGVPFPDDGSVQLRTARQDPQLMGDQILRACEDFVAFECAAQPVVLVLEDLQWGDAPTVKFVDAVVRQLPDRPLMVMALARPEVDTVFPRLWAERNVARIQLGELTKRAGEKLVREALGKRADEAMVARLVERAAGNAFYLEELIRSVADGHGDKLPETVIAMAQARIEALEVEARAVLRAASIFGQVFWRGGVMALFEGSTTQVRDWLDELCERELIVARRDSRFPDDHEYGFRHALVREAAHAMLTDADLRRGHASAGRWFEAKLAEERRGEGVGEADTIVLAEHYERGGEPRRAVGWYRRASEQALDRNDLAAAIEHAERTLACVTAAGDTEDGELVGVMRQVQADAHVWRGEYELAAVRGTEALDRLAPGTAPWLLAAAAVADACTRRLERDRVMDLSRALVHVDAAPATYRAYAHAASLTMGQLLWHGDAELIAAMFARLDEIERVIGLDDPAALAWILHAHSWRALRAGDLAACLSLDAKSYECFKAVGDLRNACQHRANVGYDELMLGASARAEASLREVIALATRIGLHQVTTMAQHNLGLALVRQGRVDEARTVETAALEALVAQGNARLASAAHHYLAVIELAAGNHPSAIEHSRLAIEGAADQPSLRSQFHATLARVYFSAGDAAASLAHARTAMQLMETYGRPEEGEAEVRLAYAEALQATGATQRAMAVIADAQLHLLEAAGRITDPAWRQVYLESIPAHATTLALARALGV
jgi:tetratricopeptide (TPR) repeat protein